MEDDDGWLYREFYLREDENGPLMKEDDDIMGNDSFAMSRHFSSNKNQMNPPPPLPPRKGQPQQQQRQQQYGKDQDYWEEFRLKSYDDKFGLSTSIPFKNHTPVVEWWVHLP